MGKGHSSMVEPLLCKSSQVQSHLKLVQRDPFLKPWRASQYCQYGARGINGFTWYKLASYVPNSKASVTEMGKEAIFSYSPSSLHLFVWGSITLWSRFRAGAVGMRGNHLKLFPLCSAGGNFPSADLHHWKQLSVTG